MAQTVIDSYSAELTQGLPPLYAPVKTTQLQGRVRIATFTRQYVTEAAGDDTALVVLPKGAKILNIHLQLSASSGAATLAVGIAGKDKTGFIDGPGTISDSNAFFRAAAALTVTTDTVCGDTQALNTMYETLKEVWITITTAAAAMANQLLTGYVLYVVD